MAPQTMADDGVQKNYRDTHANGQRVRINTWDDGIHARRLAAALPRGDARVNRVTSSHSHDATVWLSGDRDADAEPGYVEADGWEVKQVWVSETGRVAIDFDREEP